MFQNRVASNVFRFEICGTDFFFEICSTLSSRIYTGTSSKILGIHFVILEECFLVALRLSICLVTL
ncbi:hypothetical protein DLM76_09515 [Leptospira yasudae]|nr:hypothetical protein DLM76_09515 [Leptospira yasudae]